MEDVAYIVIPSSLEQPFSPIDVSNELLSYVYAEDDHPSLEDIETFFQSVYFVCTSDNGGCSCGDFAAEGICFHYLAILVHFNQRTFPTNLGESSSNGRKKKITGALSVDAVDVTTLLRSSNLPVSKFTGASSNSQLEDVDDSEDRRCVQDVHVLSVSSGVDISTHHAPVQPSKHSLTESKAGFEAEVQCALETFTRVSSDSFPDTLRFPVGSNSNFSTSAAIPALKLWDWASNSCHLDAWLSLIVASSWYFDYYELSLPDDSILSKCLNCFPKWVLEVGTSKHQKMNFKDYKSAFDAKNSLLVHVLQMLKLPPSTPICLTEHRDFLLARNRTFYPPQGSSFNFLEKHLANAEVHRSYFAFTTIDSLICQRCKQVSSLGHSDHNAHLWFDEAVAFKNNLESKKYASVNVNRGGTCSQVDPQNITSVCGGLLERKEYSNDSPSVIFVPIDHRDNQPSRSVPDCVDLPVVINNKLYIIVAIGEFLPNSVCGHYTSFVRHPQFGWLFYDDLNKGSLKKSQIHVLSPRTIFIVLCQVSTIGTDGMLLCSADICLLLISYFNFHCLHFPQSCLIDK